MLTDSTPMGIRGRAVAIGRRWHHSTIRHHGIMWMHHTCHVATSRRTKKYRLGDRSVIMFGPVPTSQYTQLSVQQQLTAVNSKISRYRVLPHLFAILCNHKCQTFYSDNLIIARACSDEYSYKTLMWDPLIDIVGGNTDLVKSFRHVQLTNDCIALELP